MLLKTADWDDNLLAHNALATESAFLSYQLIHEFNRPAKAIIELSDPSGAIAQKYDVDAANDSVYIGPGRAYIEDPTGTAIFEGRIVRAVPDMNNHRLVLECEDWLSQLDDDKIIYDMREDLDPLDAAGVQGLRQSEAHAQADSDFYIREVSSENIDATRSYAAPVYTDETAEAQSAAAGDMNLMAGGSVNDAYYFGWYVPQTGVTVTIETGGEGDYTVTWEYWDGAAWSALAGVSDGSSGWTLTGARTISWTLPTDWATVAVDGTTLYWVRARLSAVTAVETVALGTQVTSTTYFLFDDDMSWTADDYNSMYVVLTGGMAGTQTIGSGPYKVVATEHNDGLDINTPYAYTAWLQDNLYDQSQDNDSSFEVDYYFRFPFTKGSLFTSGSITAVRLKALFHVTSNSATIQVDDTTNGWITLHDIICDGVNRYMVLDIPVGQISDIFDANGNIIVRFDCNWASGTLSLQVDYLWIEIDCTTTGYSSAIAISDTRSNHLQIGTDLTAAAQRIWEGCPYSIAQPIYKHIASDESPGGLIDDGDVLYGLTCTATIEHTSGISLRHYHERSRLEILEDLAQQDKSVFWITLGGTTVTWKSTFNDGAPTAVTDASVLFWRGDWSYKSMFNEAHVYGATIGDHQLTAEDTDATSQSTYGIARTQVVTQSGLFTQYDCAQLADKLVDQNKDTQLYLEATIGGLSTLRLGSEVAITSTYLGLSGDVYTVTHWAYDSKRYRTTIRLQPRASTTGYQKNVALTEFRKTVEGQEQTQRDMYIPSLTTQEWT